MISLSRRFFPLFCMGAATLSVSCDSSELIDNEPTPLPEVIPASDWMKYVHDTMPVSRLSIPGTHDSAAFLEKLIASARCQSGSVAEQLEQGVRYLDIRPKATSVDQTEDLPIYHGIINTEITLATVLDQMTSFLDKHPEEMLIYTMRNEDTNSKYQDVWKQTIRTLFEKLKQEGRTVDMSSDMRLGACRGKILFLTRTGSSDYRAEGGLYVGGAQNWADNCTFRNQLQDPSGNSVVVGNIEDYYKLAKSDEAPAKEDAIARKKEEIRNNLTNARENRNPDEWYVTYTSGYTAFGFLGLADGTPHDLAVENNPFTLEYILSNKGTTGIVAMDYASDETGCKGNSLIQAIINQNFGR